MPQALQALLWDVDGTLAETERDGHRVAFNQAFEALAVPRRWSEADYGRLLAVTGGRERLLHDMAQQPWAPADASERARLAERLHRLKNERYADIVARAALPLREGVRELLDECACSGVRLAIVTTTSRANVQALLTAHFGLGWRAGFDAVVCGEDVADKKPSPQAYVAALRALGLRGDQALAIEDSPAGVAAAHGAGVPVVVTRSHYFADAAVGQAVAVGPSLGRREGWTAAAGSDTVARVDLPLLRQWHRLAVPQAA
ncbi:MAG: HAD-IA family hydrolase [Burkholderiaceae bacterium]